MPFGLKVASAALNRAMEKVLKDILEFVLCFVDDMSVLSQTFLEHIYNLEKVFKQLIRYNVTLNFEKCKFCRKEIHFLGHILTPEGLMQDPQKIEKIQNYRRPKNFKQLQQFLGFLNYYNKFAQNYAREIVPLLNLLRKGVKYKWTDEHEKAFENVKKLFLKEKVLVIPDLNKQYILTCDGSKYAIGSVLSQIDDNGEEKIITCISRTLKASELSYFVCEIELLSVIYALQKLNTFLAGSKILVKVDHQAITFMQKCKFVNNRLKRWCLAFQDYDITYEYIQGRKNVVADILSRGYDQNYEPENRKEILISTVLKEKPSTEITEMLKNIENLPKND